MKKFILTLGLMLLLALPACANPPLIPTVHHAVTVNNSGAVVGDDAALFANLFKTGVNMKFVITSNLLGVNVTCADTNLAGFYAPAGLGYGLQNGYANGAAKLGEFSTGGFASWVIGTNAGFGSGAWVTNGGFLHYDRHYEYASTADSAGLVYPGPGLTWSVGNVVYGFGATNSFYAGTNPPTAVTPVFSYETNLLLTAAKIGAATFYDNSGSFPYGLITNTTPDSLDIYGPPGDAGVANVTIHGDPAAGGGQVTFNASGMSGALADVNGDPIQANFFDPAGAAALVQSNLNQLATSIFTSIFTGTVTNLASSVLTGSSYSNVVVLQQGSPLDGVYANPGTSVYGNASMTFYSMGTNWALGSFSYGQQYYLVGQAVYGSPAVTNWCFFSYFKSSAIGLPNTILYSTNSNLTATPPPTGWSAYSGYTPTPTYYPSSVYLTKLVQHFNLTTYTNGIVKTNVFQ